MYKRHDISGAVSGKRSVGPTFAPFWYIIISVFFISGAVFFGCTPQKTVIQSEPPSQTISTGDQSAGSSTTLALQNEGDDLFARAEKRFQDHAYADAAALYKEYADAYSDAEKVPAALMKLGALESAFGRYDEADLFYERLIRDYPDHPYRHEAAYQILSDLYKQNRFHELINRAESAPEPGADRMRTLFLLGAAHEQLSDYIGAAAYYYEGHMLEKAMGESAFYKKMESVLQKLSADDIQVLMSRVDDPLIKSRLMFLKADKLAEENRYDAAVETLTDYMDRYETGEYVHEAAGKIREYGDRFEFEPYTVGILLPMSGRYRAVGKKALRGIEMAVMDMGMTKRSDGLKAKTRIVVKDTASDPNTAVDAVAMLDDEHVAAIIGPLAFAEESALEAQKRKIPMIALSQKKGIPEIGNYIFRNFVTPEMQVEALVSFAEKDLEVHRFAILYPDEPYGSTFMNLFWDKVDEMDGEVTGAESYDPDITDFADPIKKLVGLYHRVPDRLRDAPREYRTNPKTGKAELTAVVDFDVLFIPDSPAVAGMIIPQLAYYDVANMYLFGTNLWHSDALIQMAGKYVQGAIMPDGFFKESESPAVNAFVDRFTEIYEEPPGIIEAAAYDSAMILFDIVNREDVRFRSAVVDALTHLSDYKGITGKTAFTKDGEAKKDLYMLQVRGDSFIEIR